MIAGGVHVAELLWLLAPIDVAILFSEGNGLGVGGCIGHLLGWDLERSGWLSRLDLCFHRGRPYLRLRLNRNCRLGFFLLGLLRRGCVGVLGLGFSFGRVFDLFLLPAVFVSRRLVVCVFLFILFFRAGLTLVVVDFLVFAVQIYFKASSLPLPPKGSSSGFWLCPKEVLSFFKVSASLLVA